MLGAGLQRAEQRELDLAFARDGTPRHHSPAWRNEHRAWFKDPDGNLLGLFER
jgi:hypothetical protein